MESKELQTIEKWFGQLNQRFDSTDQKVENRFTALLNVCTHIREDIALLKKDLNSLRADFNQSKDQYEARISTIELALKELERRLA